MHLLRLSIENWRGIERRDIEFAEGVTLIEGPNEIGKSTIIEAVRTLFSEPDSSKKKAIKAIQPVGRDVGSFVEAEIRLGPYHIVYAKTFNRGASTTLKVLAPKSTQLTGREAHDRVSQMMTESMDAALWQALLVDQGEKVALANLKDSAGLARALDEAAGSSAAGDEDGGFLAAIQGEYEKYFTLRTGRPKFAAQEAAHLRARQAFDVARESLAAIETDIAAHDRSVAEVRRLESQLPQLRSRLEQHEESWKSVRLLREQVAAQTKEVETAEELRVAAAKAYAERREQVATIDISRRELDEAEARQQPGQRLADDLQHKCKQAQLVLDELKKKLRVDRELLKLAQDDERYLADSEALTRNKKRLEELRKIVRDRKAALASAGSITIDPAGLGRWRSAEQSRAVAVSARDAAATSFTVSAEQQLQMEIGDETVELGEGDSTRRSVSAVVNIRIPDVAAIQITPSQSVAGLQDKVEEADRAINAFRKESGLADLDAATAACERKTLALQDADRLKARQQDILQDATQEELEQSVLALQVHCDRYRESRRAMEALPGDSAAATARVTEKRQAVVAREASVESAQETCEKLQRELEAARQSSQQARQELIALGARLAQREEQLQLARTDLPDDDVSRRAERAEESAQQAAIRLKDLQEQLESSAPDALELQLQNARGARERAERDLAAQQQQLAVLADRLQQTRADGRYETLEAAERTLEEARRQHEATQRKAAAVQLLWDTINQHRDAARKVYVEPLKEALGRLGSIVFGADFEVDIDEAWTIRSETRDGQTLDFDSLSIGTQEQLGILMRLAAAQIVAKQGGVPLIIDDALGFSDPERLESMGAAIAAAGRDCQIILLTCTPGRFAHVGNATLIRF
ncbi:MAG: AAA family ATPase [Woeseia sp.]